jgi:hypothetical protein
LLYTFLFSFRRHRYVSQVQADSVIEAIRRWADQLDHRTIHDFGQRSKDRLLDAIQRNQFGPNAVRGLANVWDWAGPISEFDSFVHIVATDETPAD